MEKLVIFPMLDTEEKFRASLKVDPLQWLTHPNGVLTITTHERNEKLVVTKKI